MKKNKNKMFTVICILICGICLSYLGYYFVKQQQQNGRAEEVEKYKIQKTLVSERTQENTEKIPIDFAGLKQVNTDIYAWLEVEGTNIKEPILQSSVDDSYYLDHLYDGSKSPYGAVFTERINAKDFKDFNTVIYGHNTKTVSGFHDLHQFAEEDFFEKNDTIIIYTETEKKEYRIFAALEYDNRHILYHYNNAKPEERQQFLRSLRESRSMKNQFRKEVMVDENNRIITLSTCIKGVPEKRWIVEAVEVNGEEK